MRLIKKVCLCFDLLRISAAAAAAVAVAVVLLYDAGKYF